MIKLGVTGGIGSGKSVVCEVLRIEGIPVYDADREAKKLNDSSPLIRHKLTQAFGPALYANDGKLDRKKLARLLFDNKENLHKVHAIVHPEVARHFARWIERKKAFPVVAMEAAVLFEAGFESLFHKTLSVVAPPEVRIRRVMNRDAVSAEEVQRRINSQMSDEERIKRSDFVLINDNRQSLLRQLSGVLRALEEEASRKSNPSGGLLR